jgi:hypothetical protein
MRSPVLPRFVIAAASVFLPLAGAFPAVAQPSAQDSAAAQALYDDAQKLMTAGNFAAACPKLEESQRLDPTASTEFHLADCYEKSGRTASAWAAFLEVAAASKRAGRTDREQIARDRAAALEPKLSHLTIVVPDAAKVAGLAVKRDGELVREGQWGTPVPVDPGKHSLEASAPGKQTWSTSVDVPAGGKAASVDVQPLAEGASAPPPQPGAEAPPSSWPTQKTIALVVGAVGVVGVGVGSYFGVTALSKNSDSSSHCNGNSCDATGVGLRSDAVSDGNISTVAIGVGAAAVVGAAVLWFTAPKGTGVEVAPAVGERSQGIVLSGKF